MSKLNEKYEIIRNILKYDYIRFSPAEISTINNPNSQIFINIPRGDSVNSLKGCLLKLNFDVLHIATTNRYVDGNYIGLVNLGSIALLNIYKLATSSGKHIEANNPFHIVCLMYELIISARNTDNLSIGFDRDR